MNKFRFLFLTAILIIIGATAGAQLQSRPEGRLRVASCQFPISGDIVENFYRIKQQLEEARLKGADIVHFPECALSGYPGTDMESMEGFQWDTLQHYTGKILDLALRHKMWIVLGSAHRLSGPNKPHNCLYVISDEGKIIDRYDKRFCTSGDLKYFSPGDHFVTFEVNGVKCGLLICYDIRFPELYREYRKMEVDLIFQSFHNARKKTPGIHPVIMPLTSQARAATNYFYMSITNSSAAESWPCHFILPNGLIQGKNDLNVPGVLISDMDISEEYYDASRRYRMDAISGKLNSGETVKDARSDHRQGLLP